MNQTKKEQTWQDKEFPVWVDRNHDEETKWCGSCTLDVHGDGHDCEVAAHEEGEAGEGASVSTYHCLLLDISSSIPVDQHGIQLL